MLIVLKKPNLKYNRLNDNCEEKVKNEKRAIIIETDGKTC
jgi:hypothetical protein